VSERAHDGVPSTSINGAHDGRPNGFLVFVTHDGSLTWQSQPFVAEDYFQVYQKTLKPGDANDSVYWATPAPQFTDMQFSWVGVPYLEMFTTGDGGKHWQRLELRSLPKNVEQLQFISSDVPSGLHPLSVPMEAENVQVSDETEWNMKPSRSLVRLEPSTSYEVRCIAGKSRW
jgi:hypothetical protein